MKSLRVQLTTLAIGLAVLAATSGFLAGRGVGLENGTVSNSNSIRTGQVVLVSDPEAVAEREQWLAALGSAGTMAEAEKTLRELEARQQWNDFLTRVQSGLRDKRKLDQFEQQPLAPATIEADFLGAFVPGEEVAALTKRLEALAASPDPEELKEVESELEKLRDRLGSSEEIKAWAQAQLDKYQAVEE